MTMCLIKRFSGSDLGRKASALRPQVHKSMNGGAAVQARAGKGLVGQPSMGCVARFKVDGQQAAQHGLPVIGDQGAGKGNALTHLAQVSLVLRTQTMAQRLGTLGWAPWVHDIDAAKVESLKLFGALAPVNIHHAAITSVATIICVVDAEQTRDVLFGPQGIAPHLRPGHVVVLCPTIAPEDVEAIAAQLGALGVDTIDAPMSGGPARARDGSMSLLVAGADAVVARCEPLLQALSSKVFRISERPGDGARTKLVNNLLVAVISAGTAEAFGDGKRKGGFARGSGADHEQSLWL
jgi:hypothetical protein